MRFLSLIDGILKLKEAIASFTGQANQIVATDSTGKVAKNLLPGLALDELQDVIFGSSPGLGNILVYKGQWVASRPLLSWVWQVYDNSVSAGSNPAFRFNSVPSSSVRYRSPVKAQMLYAVSSTQDVDGFYIDIYVDGALKTTLTHPNATSTRVHNLSNFILFDSEELYVIFRRFSNNNSDNVALDMFFIEKNDQPILILN